MRWNFSGAIQDINPELRKKLEETITGHLHGTYQALRLMNQQGNFTRMSEPLASECGRLLEDGGSPVFFRRC